MQPLAGIHVVLVEDDPDARTVMQLIMEYQGALVLPAGDSKSALEMLATVKPDVLVSDISMPDHDGFWLLNEARRLGRLTGVPTLAVTALDLDPAELRDGGFDAGLRKPVDPNALCNSVQALARGRKSDDAV
jgi:CheY-like chemotaxis protein